MVRLGLPGLVAAVALAGAFGAHNIRGWCLLLLVACFAEMGTVVHRGRAYLRHRASILRWEGRWLQALRPLFRRLGMEESWLRSFLAWNNLRVEAAFRRDRARRTVVLLPHCIQLAACRLEVTQRAANCVRCGRCVLGDAVEDGLEARWDLRVFNRSHKAARYAREAGPDLMIAASCPDRLIKGLLKLPETPCFALPLALPHGMCVDTTFDPAQLRLAMETLALPAPERPAKVQPLQTSGIA